MDKQKHFIRLLGEIAERLGMKVELNPNRKKVLTMKGMDVSCS